MTSTCVVLVTVAAQSVVSALPTCWESSSDIMTRVIDSTDLFNAAPVDSITAIIMMESWHGWLRYPTRLYISALTLENAIILLLPYSHQVNFTGSVEDTPWLLSSQPSQLLHIPQPCTLIRENQSLEVAQTISISVCPIVRNTCGYCHWGYWASRRRRASQ